MPGRPLNPVLLLPHQWSRRVRSAVLPSPTRPTPSPRLPVDYPPARGTLPARHAYIINRRPPRPHPMTLQPDQILSHYRIAEKRASGCVLYEILTAKQHRPSPWAASLFRLRVEMSR
jgi:hypothetical protein